MRIARRNNKASHIIRYRRKFSTCQRAGFPSSVKIHSRIAALENCLSLFAGHSGKAVLIVSFGNFLLKKHSRLHHSRVVPGSCTVSNARKELIAAQTVGQLLNVLRNKPRVRRGGSKRNRRDSIAFQLLANSQKLIVSGRDLNTVFSKYCLIVEHQRHCLLRGHAVHIAVIGQLLQHAIVKGIVPSGVCIIVGLKINDLPGININAKISEFQSINDIRFGTGTH